MAKTIDLTNFAPGQTIGMGQAPPPLPKFPGSAPGTTLGPQFPAGAPQPTSESGVGGFLQTLGGLGKDAVGALLDNPEVLKAIFAAAASGAALLDARGQRKSAQQAAQANLDLQTAGLASAEESLAERAPMREASFGRITDRLNAPASDMFSAHFNKNAPAGTIGGRDPSGAAVPNRAVPSELLQQLGQAGQGSGSKPSGSKLSQTRRRVPEVSTRKAPSRERAKLRASLNER